MQTERECKVQEETRRGLLAGSGRSDSRAARSRGVAPCVTAFQVPSSAARCRLKEGSRGGADDGTEGKWWGDGGEGGGGPLGRVHPVHLTGLAVNKPNINPARARAQEQLVARTERTFTWAHSVSTTRILLSDVEKM